MLHRKDNYKDERLELLQVQLEKSLDAVLDNVLDQFEKALSELWIGNSVIFNHIESALA